MSLPHAEDELCHVLDSCLAGRVVFLGIGNTLRSDDGVGVHLVRALREQCPLDHVAFLECETTPENHVAPVARFQPDAVLMIDATELGQQPGAAMVLEAGQIADVGGTTHTFSLGLVADALCAATGVTPMLLAIQPGNREFGSTLSPEVERARDRLVRIIVRALKFEDIPPIA